MNFPVRDNKVLLHCIVLYVYTRKQIRINVLEGNKTLICPPLIYRKQASKPTYHYTNAFACMQRYVIVSATIYNEN